MRKERTSAVPDETLDWGSSAEICARRSTSVSSSGLGGFAARVHIDS